VACDRARFTGLSARVLQFSLDELRSAYGHLASPGADPRHDTAPFRAFRAALLEAAARAAVRPCDLSMAWGGTFNGYRLLVSVEPPGALPGLDLTAVCAAEQDQVAPARPDRYPLAHVEPGHATLARAADGTTHEAPFGAATGHFGAPGIRRMR
jgi:hypothetical protein